MILSQQVHWKCRSYSNFASSCQSDLMYTVLKLMNHDFVHCYRLALPCKCNIPYSSQKRTWDGQSESNHRYVQQTPNTGIRTCGLFLDKNALIAMSKGQEGYWRKLSSRKSPTKYTGGQEFMGSKVQCLFCSESCTTEGRGGEKWGCANFQK